MTRTEKKSRVAFFVFLVVVVVVVVVIVVVVIVVVVVVHTLPDQWRGATRLLNGFDKTSSARGQL